MGTRVSVLLAVGSLAVAWLVPATARATGGCADVSASAVDQYCEMTPTAAGPRVPGNVAGNVGACLPAAERRALRRTVTGRALLALPAAGPRRGGDRGAGLGPAGRGAGVDPISLGLPLIAVMAAVAVGLIGIAVRRRLRRD